MNPINGTAAGEQTNYQLKMTVHKGEGEDSATDVYCGGNCRNDFGDIRWTEDDGTTLMDYWIESIESGVQAVFWVEIPSIPASPDTVDCYMYYDKSDATTTSSGEDTFPEFTHFPGSALPEDWQQYDDDMGSYSVANSKLTVQTDAVSHATWYHQVVGTTATWGRNHAIRARVTAMTPSGTPRNKTTSIGFAQNEDYNSPLYSKAHSVELYTNGRFDFYCYHNETGTSNQDLTISPPLTIDLSWIEDKAVLKYNASESEITTNVPDGEHPAMVIASSGLDTYGPYSIEIDWFLIRKYADPEPTWGSWGGEETAAVEYERPIEQGFSLAGLAPSGAEFGRTIEQGFGFGAVVAIVMEICRLLSQTFGFTGVVGVISEWGKSLTQDFSLDGSIEANRELSGGISQDFYLDGSISIGVEYGCGVSQEFSFTGSIEVNRELSRDIVQYFSLDGSITVEKEIAINLSDTFSLSATVTAPSSFVRELSEELSFTATLDDTEEYGKSLSEDFSLGATVDIAIQKEIRITQDLVLTGTVQATRELGIGITQTYSISDAVTAGEEYGGSLTQDYSLTGVVATSFEFTQAISQDFSFGDEVAIEVSRLYNVYSYDLSGELSFTDMVATNAEYGLVVSQEFSFAGLVEAQVTHLKPELVGPIEDQPLFVWAYVGADNYRLLVDNNIDFSSPCENRIVFENHYQIPPENALDNGVYYWKVIAYFDEEAVESDMWSFVVGGTGASPIDLVSIAMFLFPIVLMGIALAFDNPVFASFAGVVFILSGLFFIDTIWLAMIFAGIGVYLLITAFMSEED
ncbi:MAG: DUF2341 domain-containing protein [Desulfobacterales bacterium]|nr:DUF2341 domain-containing protein [Desulfobacterales bacterium]